MLIAGKAMAGALEILRPLLAETGAQSIGTIVMGTVKGDVHDIGKNLVNIMFEGAGFQVIDLGVQVAPEKFIDAIQEHQPDIVGLLRVPHHDHADVQGEHQRAAEGRPARPGDRDGRRRPGHPGVRGRGRAPTATRPTRRPPWSGPRNCSSGAARWPAPERRGRRMETVLRSATRELRIGPEQPFCIIGERINPTGRKIFQEQLRAGDLSRVEIDVAQQVAGGAMVLDVNMGAPLADEAELMVRAVKLVQGLPTCRCASTPRSSRRSTRACPPTRARRWSTR